MSTVAFILAPVTEVVIKSAKKIKPSESELIKGLRSGSTASLDSLYSMYSATLYGIILRIVKKDEYAEDLLQDTFIKIWQSFKQYDSTKGRLYTWMSNIARNVAIDQIKTKAFRNNAKNENINDISQTVDFQYNTSSNPDIIGLKSYAMKLKPEQRSVLDLIYFGGYTHVEAAEELGIPVGTLKTRLRMAVSQLRKVFN